MDKAKSIKIGDFARECGVSDRAIYKHLQKHESELEGHLDKQGSNGTWLDEYAQNYVRGLMLRQPVTVIQDNEEFRMLREENIELRAQLQQSTTHILKLQEIVTGQAEQLAEGRAAQMLLEAAESRQSELEAKVERYRLDIDNTREEAKKAAQEALEARNRAEAAEAEAMRLKSRGFWDRIRNR